MMRCLLVCIQHLNARLQKKTSQNRFVSRSLCRDGKSGAQFAQHDARKPHFIGGLNGLDHLIVSTAKDRYNDWC